MKSLQAILLLTSFTLLGLIGQAQDYFPPIVNYSTQDYGKDKNPENTCAVQDQRGVMYFGNAHGVIEYDGKNWRFIVVTEGVFVHSLAIDSSGVIYVGSERDFGYLKPDENGQLQYESLLPKVLEEDRWFGIVWKVFATKNEVYFQSQESFFVYDIESKKVKTVYPQDFESTFHTSFLVNSTFYVRERMFGLVKYENGELKTLTGTDTVSGYGVFGLHSLKNGSLLVITQELGIWKWSKGTMHRLPELNETSSTEWGVISSVKLSDGNYALSTSTHGVIIINSKGKIEKIVDRSRGMRSNEVKYIFEDRDQNIWVTMANGISKVNYHSPLSYFNEKSGIEGNVDAVVRFKGRLIVGTSFGIFVQNKDNDSDKEFLNTELLKAKVWDFHIVNEKLYIATSKGVYSTIDGVKFQQINALNTNAILYIDDKELFISAGAEGLFVHDKSFNIIWSELINISTAQSIKPDPTYENTFWIGSLSNGVVRLQLNEPEYIVDQYYKDDGLNDNQLTRPIIFEDKMVFGSTQGLLKFIGEEDMKINLTEEELQDPLNYRGMFQGNTLYDSVFNAQILLLVEDKNRTWYCADDKIGYYDFKTKTFINKPFWGINYGRVNNFYLEDDGVLWIGCADGLIRYEKNTRKQYHTKFYSLIRQFSAKQDSSIFSGAFTDATGNLIIGQNPDDLVELTYDINDVFFSFSAPYFEDEHIPEFSYKLEGHNEKWSNWNLKTDANFTNLHEGDYSFKVRARNIYGHISEEAVYKFVILPPWYRTTWAYILYVFAFILIFFLGLKLSSARLKRKNIWLEGVVEERTKEISDKNVVLFQQKKEIEDSINYAQRIQEAILPLDLEMKSWLPKSFVLFRPKDIVSGDFYWFMEKGRKLVFVCADCTGHGVPGAFMSMIGSDRLNNIVNENDITNPGEILSELNKAIKKSLKQDGQKDSTKDGMDAAVCTIDIDKQTLKYAGAFRPLWIVKDNEIEEIKATKVAVAGFTPDDQIFETHEIPLDGKTKYYMSSDGYADQFGGPRGKKYKVKQMKEFIINNCKAPFDKQKELLESELIHWMESSDEEIEQIDDVCVIGFEA